MDVEKASTDTEPTPEPEVAIDSNVLRRTSKALSAEEGGPDSGSGSLDDTVNPIYLKGWKLHFLTIAYEVLGPVPSCSLY